MELISPSISLIDSWKSFVEECDAQGMRHYFWNYPQRPQSWEAYVQNEPARRTQQTAEQPMPLNSTYWLVESGEILAVTNIRHELNEGLRKRGGHIGYSVRPSLWGRGYGSAILRMALPKARELIEGNILITCDAQNKASQRIIQKCGGTLREEQEVDGVTVQRWLIEN